ncbi:thioredoxin, partial [Cooperia oncophora]
MPVHLSRNLADFQSKIGSADRNRLFVVDFYADWCGPCRFIAPIVEQFSSRFTNATFLKVNVDNSPEGREMERIQGANPQALELAISRHYSSAPSNPNAATDREKRFLQQFVPYVDKVKLYSDIVYKTLAISLIPADD